MGYFNKFSEIDSRAVELQKTAEGREIVLKELENDLKQDYDQMGFFDKLSIANKQTDKLFSGKRFQDSFTENFGENNVDEELQNIQDTAKTLKEGTEEIAKYPYKETFNLGWEEAKIGWKGIFDSIDRATDGNFYNSVLNSEYGLSSQELVENLRKKKDELITKEDWEKSEFYRPEINDFQEYWTLEDAEKKANYIDQKKATEKLQEENGSFFSPVLGMIAHTPGFFISPEGVGALALSVATGGIGASSVLGKALKEGLIFAGATASTKPFFYKEIGEKFEAKNYLEDVGGSFIAGGVFSLAHQGLAKLYKKVKNFKQEGKLKEEAEGIIQTAELFDNIEKEDLAVDTQRLEDIGQILENGKTENKDFKLKTNEYVELNDTKVSYLPLIRENLNVKKDSPIREINGKWVILEGNNLAENGKNKIQPSHLINEGYTERFKKNPEYTANQPKEISDIAFDDFTEKAKDLSINAFFDNNTIHSGFPMVLKDGSVVSGNHRTLYQVLNYQKGDYVKLKNGLIERGFEKANDFDYPIVAFEIQDELSQDLIRELAESANKPTTGTYSNLENAKLESIELGENAFSKLADNLEATSKNEDFINEFLKNKTPEEKRKLINTDGSLTKEAIQRLEQAVVYEAYKSPKIIDAIFSSTKDETFMSLQNSLLENAPIFARIKGLITKNVLQPKADITPIINDAFVDLINLKDLEPKLRGEYMLKYFEKLIDVGYNMQPLQESLIRAFFEDEKSFMSKVISKEKGSEMIKKLGRFLEESGTKDNLLGDLTDDVILDEFHRIKKEVKANSNLMENKELYSIRERDNLLKAQEQISKEEFTKKIEELNKTIKEDVKKEKIEGQEQVKENATEKEAQIYSDILGQEKFKENSLAKDTKLEVEKEFDNLKSIEEKMNDFVECITK
jgi:hypothetical protein